MKNRMYFVVTYKVNNKKRSVLESCSFEQDLKMLTIFNDKRVFSIKRAHGQANGQNTVEHWNRMYMERDEYLSWNELMQEKP